MVYRELYSHLKRKTAKETTKKSICGVVVVTKGKDKQEQKKTQYAWELLLVTCNIALYSNFHFRSTTSVLLLKRHRVHFGSKYEEPEPAGHLRYWCVTPTKKSRLLQSSGCSTGPPVA